MGISSDAIPSRKVNVLWDSGATFTLITFKKANQLNLIGENIGISVIKIGGEKETIPSYAYDLPLRDKSRQVITFRVYDVDKISTDVKYISVNGVVHLFDDIKEVDIQRPTDEIDVLVGYEYAGLHPVREQSVGLLIILNNQFGQFLTGTHQMLKEKTQKLVQHIVIHHIERVKLEDVYSTEAMRVQCYPKCGSCPIGGRNYTLKVERELNFDKGLRHEDGYWVAKYPWIKDPNNFPDSKQAVMRMLKSTENTCLRTKSMQRWASNRLMT